MSDEKRRRYWWWNLDELQDEGLLDMWAKEGSQNLRLEFHPDEDPGLFLVDKRTGEVCGKYNVIHTCPPDCN